MRCSLINEVISDELAGEILDLEALPNALPALSPSLVSTFAEAASLCYELNGHEKVLLTKISGYRSEKCAIRRCNITDQVRRSYKDKQYAAEWGAYAVSFLLMKRLVGFSVVEQSAKGGGFDYWLGDDEDVLLFNRKARLEVSGIFKGSSAQVRYRANRKVEQTNPSDGSYPAYVSVVEFSEPTARIIEKKTPS